MTDWPEDPDAQKAEPPALQPPTLTPRSSGSSGFDVSAIELPERELPERQLPERELPGEPPERDVPTWGLPALEPSAQEPSALPPSVLPPSALAPDEAALDIAPGLEPVPSTPAAFGTSGALVEEEPPAPPLRPRRTRLGTIQIGARALVGTIGIGIAVLAIAAATWLPLPQHAANPPAMLVAPATVTQQRVCPGPVLQFGTGIGTEVSSVSSVGQPTVIAASNKGTAEVSALAASANSSGTSPSVVTLAPGTSGQRLLSGSQSESVGAADLAGFAAAECVEAGSESWLVGGATNTGRTTVVILNNPGAVDAVVSITVFTEKGIAAAAGNDGIVVPPHTQRVLPLSGFAPGVLSPVVLVSTQSGQIAANLQQDVVRTLTPGGVTIVGAGQAPAKRVVIPGVILSTTDAISAKQDGPASSDLGPVLRLYAPGSKAVAVEVNLVPENGSAPDEPVSLSVQGGVVTDVPLDAGDGSFTIDISADAPIVAGARTSTVGASGAIDLAWFNAAQELHDAAEVGVAPGPAPKLHLSNPASSPAHVVLAASGHDAVAVTVPAGASVAVPVSGGVGYSVTGFADLRMSVSYLGDGQLSGFAVSNGTPMASPVRVYP